MDAVIPQGPSPQAAGLDPALLGRQRGVAPDRRGRGVRRLSTHVRDGAQRALPGGGGALNAFLVSAVSVLMIVASGAAAIFPNMVPAINDPRLSLTIANASSSPLTLKTMPVLALIGVPLVLVYTVWVHLMFRGKAADAAGY